MTLYIVRLSFLAYEELVLHPHDFVFPVAVEDDYIIDVRAVAYEFVFLQPCADEAFLAVDVELFVGFRHFGGYDGVKVAYLGAAGEAGSVFFL